LALSACGGNVTPDPPATAATSIAMGAEGARGPAVGVLVSPVGVATAAVPAVTVHPLDPYPEEALTATTSAAPPTGATTSKPSQPPSSATPESGFDAQF